MSLRSLRIDNLRIIKQAEVQFSPGINLFFGKNASGKTSLLEAIYFLGTARSFRSRILSDYLRKGEEFLQVSGCVAAHNREISLGIRRDASNTLMRAGGEAVQRVSSLALWLPIHLISPESHTLIAGGPKLRRSFLDWALFHVEPGFIVAWHRYERCLRQRNATLRQVTLSRKPEISKILHPWNLELNEAAQQLNQWRQEYIDALKAEVSLFIPSIVGEHRVSIEYFPGWDTSKSLLEILEQSLDQDMRRGFTHYGAHRFDLLVRFDGHEARKVLSRGQQKMLVMALSLAQIALFNRKTGRVCLLLMDDLSAELDFEHRQNLLKILQGVSVQLFVTAIDPEPLLLEGWAEKKKFHVEQGCITEVVY